MQLSEEAKEEKRKYYRDYYQRNKDKHKNIIKRYWENKALKQKQLCNEGVDKDE